MVKMKKGWIIGLDIGGTFTDAVMVHPTHKELVRFKSLTTPDNPASGALTAIDGILEQGGVEASDIAVVLHATTLVSNALIERKGARTALMTTSGFRDIMDIAREKKYDIYDLQLEKPQPLVPRQLRFEVKERVAADGSVYEPIDERSVALACESIRESGVEAVAVCLLHSYVNPQHERRLRDYLQEQLQNVSVCLSSDVLPEMREYERVSTTSANAYVQPVIGSYLAHFLDGLRGRGLDAALFIMLSEGGLASPDIVRRVPVRICESGPAAGAIAAATVGRQQKQKRILSFDMGGTTAKTCLIHDGEPTVTADFEVARMYRFKKGSGLPLKIPVVDLIEIGAGGGSIARINELGLIKVGPDSVGADPGPSCYARGGTLPAVTDADLILGFLDPGSFLGGRMRLSPERARLAIESQIAKPLGISVEEAALGIHSIVNENMANASRVQAVERGHDPAGYTMVAFGGAGPVHAWGVAERLDIKAVIVPPTAGLGSALGLLLAPRSYRVSRTYIGTLDGLDWRAVEKMFADMTDEAMAAMRAAGVIADQTELTRRADMRYLGQRKELTVELPPTPLRGSTSAALLQRRFEELYRRVYHRTHAGHPIEVLCWRLTASGPPITKLGSRAGSAASRSKADPIGKRPLLFPGWKKHRGCPVYRRSELMIGAKIAGPAVIEEDESTTVVGPEMRASVDRHGNLVLARR